MECDPCGSQGPGVPLVPALAWLAIEPDHGSGVLQLDRVRVAEQGVVYRPGGCPPQFGLAHDRVVCLQMAGELGLGAQRLLVGVEGLACPRGHLCHQVGGPPRQRRRR